ncbi:YagK/YfjJ domain-containing protein [Variovorax sp. RB2P76]|uniref:YagK/YfjJ domain-containing protein n=1 Tax=Variovorax sp. RB2P76 TaxID=3443736 RepID=UPI003F44C897
MKAEIIEELDRTLNMQANPDGSSYRIGISIRSLSLLIDFMEKVIKGVAAERLITHKLQLNRYARQYDRNIAYAPHLKLFFDIWLKSNLPVDEICDTDFVGFIRALQEEGERIDIKRKMRDWERSPKENAESVHRYLGYLHERYARLIAIRLDLHLNASACASYAEARKRNDHEIGRMTQGYHAWMDGMPDDEVGEEILRAPLQLVAAKWRRFYDNMRGKPSLFKDKVGHIVSFEYARSSGYHIHLILFFDGSRRTLDHAWLAGEIGRYWDEAITRGRGYHFNCNTQKYRNNGIGVVNYHDHEKRRHLTTAALYLAKAEQFICAKPSKGFKTFSLGQIPAGWAPGLGRPRSKGRQTDDGVPLGV